MIMNNLKNIVSPILQINKTVCRVFLSTSTKVKEEKINIGKYDINYVRAGNGPHHLILSVGAHGSIWTNFKPQIEEFDREKFTVIAWDPPGYGYSRPPEREFPEDFYEKDAEYAYQLMKALKIPKYSLLGFSDGGVSSLIHAAKYPDAVNKMVVWGTNSFILPQELEIYKTTKDLSGWSKKLKEPLLAIYGEEQLAKNCENWVNAMCEIFKKRDGNICTELLKYIKAPTLILLGQKDPLVENVHASYLLIHIDGSRMHLYPEGKHYIHLRYAEDFNKRVQKFLLSP